MDINGNVLLNPTFKSLSQDMDSHLFYAQINNQHGLVDSTGKWIWQAAGNFADWGVPDNTGFWGSSL
jgi:hypothetical protein